MAQGDITPVDLAKLTAAFSGNKQTSTSKSNISGEGINALMQQILGSTQGLASVASGQKSAGLYNSSTNRQQVNDLSTRLAGELALRQASQTTTTKSPGVLGGNTGKALLAYTAYKNLSKTKGGKSLLSQGESWLDYLLGNTSVAPGALFAAGNSADPIGSLIQSQNWSPGSSTAAVNSSDSVAEIGQAVTASGEILSAADTAKMIQNANQSEDSLGAFIEALGYSKKASDASSAAAGASTVSDAAAISQTADTASTASNLSSSGTAVGSVGGSKLGYVGSALDAYSASQTDNDYRKAVGGAILNAFGFGWATPIVDKIARPLSNKAISQGEELNGLGGAFWAEPGSFISGQYNEGDMLKAAFDPADWFGGNEGGSLAGLLSTPSVLFDAIFGTNTAGDSKNFLDDIGDFFGGIFG